ncbi:DUF1289 domain-containing protein [Proteus myxofaciens]|uniref:Putative oxidoreductase n=1 Tax=Proteus myxofaciens ATCC 19692 TaxID=1354337 RepID=A0A198FB77_9GAMM|nr:DUF1289 domain-containing protein [Proteus myxofaciens]OAT21526.1 putative oxidoreductase [Proteus myxofaciens ATCC 19692]
MLEQLEFFDIPSPCIGRCEMNAQGYCMGCFRNRQERFNWSTMNQQEKRNTLRLCRQRYLRKISKTEIQIEIKNNQLNLF